MLNLRNKILLLGMSGLLALNGYNYIATLKDNTEINAGIVQSDNEYNKLTASYYKIEGTVGDVISDFVMDYDGKTVNSFKVKTDNDAIVNTGKGIELKKSGEGTAQFIYADSICEIQYSIEANPDIVETEETKTENEPPTDMKYLTCTITSNDIPAKGIIMYIDDSKNAFKSTGTFYIEESFLDSKIHTIYIAKFTNKGPIAYAVTQFTTLADDVNFMNYNESDVEINDLNINLKTDLNNLF